MTRNRFTPKDEEHLVKYIARHNPTLQGRTGKHLYRTLCENAEGKWNWSQRHTWISWHNQYSKNRQYYDKKIKKYRKKLGIEDVDSSNKRKRETDEEEEERRVKLKQELAVALREEEEESDGSQGAEPNLQQVDSEGSAESETLEKAEPVGSDDYQGDIFQDSEGGNAEAEASHDHYQKEDSEVQESVGAGEVERRDHGLERKVSDDPIPQPLYPDITTLPSPHLPSIECVVTSVPVAEGVLPSQARRVSHPEYANTQPEASSSKVQLSPSHHLPSNTPGLSKPRRKAKYEDEDLFGTPPPYTATPRHVYAKHRLPKLVEGHYGNSFGGRRRIPSNGTDSSSEEEVEKPWPPPRQKSFANKGKERERQGETDGKVTSPEKIKNEISTQKAGKTQNGTHAQISSISPVAPMFKPSLQVNARASSSRNVLPPTSAVTQHTSELPCSDLLDTNKEKTETTPTHLKHFSRAQKSGETKFRLKQDTQQGRQIQEVILGNRQLNPINRIQSPRDQNLAGPSDRQKRSLSLRNETKATTVPPMPSTSWTPGNPFISPSASIRRNQSEEKTRASHLLERRHTINNVHEDPIVGRRIDLRVESLKKLRSRSSLPSYMRASTPHLTSASVRSTTNTRRSSLLPISVAEEDRERINYLGMATAIALIAQNFGFREESVWRMWTFFKSIANTEDFCRRYRAKMGKTEDAVLEDMEKAGLDLEGLLAEMGPELEPELKPESALSIPVPSSRQSPHKKDLNVRPLLADDALSEYTPPYSSRAGQYVRLVSQGRKEEALLREERRTRGAKRLFPTPRGTSLPIQTPMLTRETGGSRSTTDGNGDEKGGNGTNEVTVSESSSRERPVDDSEDLFGDSSPWTKEEEMAFLSANRSNAAALREIEQRTDINFMLRWTAAHLAEFKGEIIPS